MEFSKEDADFVRIYAKSAIFGESEVATLARDSQYFNKSGGGSGISASMNGYVWDQINNINHTFGGNGIGKVYGDTISDSVNNTNYLYSDISDGYTAVGVFYTSKHAKATVTGQYGTFTIATY
ncbi:hypothetical protein [Bacillus mycoides]|uniref:hypothetical protein n=1 Tax=Bacillus mycoides TaxID=1405 RepID=UPI00207A50AE|nr:hypothetical protein [Bacillus mycoides]